jgi:hypothetical protein
MVMKTSHFGDDAHWTIFWWFDGAGDWAVHGQGKMGPKSMVVAEVRRQETHQVSGIQHDHVVEHVTADTADDPFTVRILPWTVWRNFHCFDAYVLDALLKMLTVDRVAVAQ